MAFGATKTPLADAAAVVATNKRPASTTAGKTVKKPPAAKGPPKSAPKKPKLSLAERAAKDPELLARAQADPGLRSKLPDNLLTAAQRASRQTTATNKAIGDPLADLSGTTLQSIARKITDGDYKPQYDQLDQATIQTGQHGQAVSGRANAYIQQAIAAQQQGMAQAQQTGDTLDANLKAAGDQQQQGIGQLANQNAQQSQQDQTVRGGGLDGGAQQAIQSQLAAGQQQAATNTQTARDTGRLQSAANANLAGELGQVAATRGIETQGSLGRATLAALQGVNDQRSKLEDNQRGDYAKNLMGLRDTQGQTDLAKATLIGNQQSDAANAANADAKTKVDAADKAATRKQKAIDAAEKRRVDTLTAYYKKAGLDEKTAHDKATEKIAADKANKPPKPTKPTKGPGSLTQAQENTLWGKIDGAVGKLHGNTNPQGVLIGANGKPIYSDGAAIAQLESAGLSNDEAYIALSLYKHHGKVSLAAVDHAHTAGLHIGGKYPVVRGAPKKPGGPIKGAGGALGDAAAAIAASQKG